MANPWLANRRPKLAYILVDNRWRLPN